MRKILVLLAVIVLVALDGCRKPYEYIEPQLYSISVNVEGTSATVVARVNYRGEKYMYVDMGKKPDLKDAKRYEMSRNGDYDFSVTVKDLDFGSKYYYRIEAGNVNFSIFSDVKSVELNEAVLKYGDGSYVSSWGYIDQGDDSYKELEWAVVFPPDLLASFKGVSVSKVKAHLGKQGSYTLKIYEGGTWSPANLIKTVDFEVSSSGWKEITFNPITVNTDTPLWIAIWTYQKKGSYVASTSKGINNRNARWVKANGSWMDGQEWASDGSDLCWLIQAVVKADVKGEKGCEIELPLNSVDLCEHK